MTLPLIKAVLATGDKYGSGLKDMMAWLKICHLGNVSDAQAQMYLERNGNNDDINNTEDKGICTR